MLPYPKWDSPILKNNDREVDNLYKLIALDLDGTLLNDKKEISHENLDLLHDLIKEGYELVIATGRSYYSARALTNNIKEHLIYICNNGNIVRDAIDDRPIFFNYLDVDDSRRILEEGAKRDLSAIVHVNFFEEGYDILVDRNFNRKLMYAKEPNYYSRAKVVDSKLEDSLDRVLAIVYPGKLDILKDFHYEINEFYPDKYNSHVMENANQAEALLEIMNPIGTKWNTLIKYANSIGIEAQEIICIGDNNNDIEMIMNAGLGIVMKNGSDLAKEVADLVSEKDNNESGVAFELKKLLKRNK